MSDDAELPTTWLGVNRTAHTWWRMVDQKHHHLRRHGNGLTLIKAGQVVWVEKALVVSDAVHWWQSLPNFAPRGAGLGSPPSQYSLLTAVRGAFQQLAVYPPITLSLENDPMARSSPVWGETRQMLILSTPLTTPPQTADLEELAVVLEPLPVAGHFLMVSLPWFRHLHRRGWAETHYPYPFITYVESLTHTVEEIPF